MVVQDVRRRMDPFVGAFDARPERGDLFQAMLDQIQQRLKRRRPPFSVTRATLSATAFNRPLSFRPEAASGGWASSVMALRPPAQEPRPTSARGSAASSTAGSIPPTPRVGFFYSALACPAASQTRPAPPPPKRD